MQSTNSLLMGLNIPGLLDRELSQELSSLGEGILELGAHSCRLPFIWAHFDPDGSGALDRNTVSHYRSVISNLPRSVKILGCIHNPPHPVAELFLTSPSDFAVKIFDFCKIIAEEFEDIAEWEIWNEPNASDFYLSTKEESGIRPWTANEFVEFVLLPGARGVKAAQPNSLLCIAGLAEDGVAGHRDRVRPALSNRLPRKKEYTPYLGEGPHGQFYFIPDFWLDLAQDLANRRSEIVSLFRACGFHPYPYFQIHARDDKSLFQATEKHTQEFLRVLADVGLDGLDVWVTEFGARSLIISGSHYDDETQQAAHLADCIQLFERFPIIRRAYWYKYIDTGFDLNQEKTFGLLDYRGNPRKAFFSFKGWADKLHRDMPRSSVVDSLTRTHAKNLVEIQNHYWNVESSTIFGYYLLSSSSPGRGEMLVYPGRRAGDYLEMTCSQECLCQSGHHPRVDIALSSHRDSGPFSLQIDFDSRSPKPLPAVVFLFGDTLKISSIDGSDEIFIEVKPCEFPFANYKGITNVSVEWRNDSIAIELEFSRVKIHRTINTTGSVGDILIVPRLRFQRLAAKPVFVAFSRFRLDTIPAERRLSQPPRNQDDEEDLWFLSLPRYSQIYQDDWVLRMLRFKRDGFFVEIGGHDGVENSNTILLERIFGWNGMIVEANPRWHRFICRNRNVPAFNNAAFSKSGERLKFVDAGAIGGLVDYLQADVHAPKRQTVMDAGKVIDVLGLRTDELLLAGDCPEIADYISIDTEGSEHEVLKGIDFTRWKFALMTIEHGGNADSRERVWSILREVGYRRHRVWFEDWFWHPEYLALALGVSENEAEEHARNVFRSERYHRRGRLMRSASELEDARSAIDILFEAAKIFHPDSVHSICELSRRLSSLGDFDMAHKILLEGKIYFPNNSALEAATHALLGMSGSAPTRQ